MKVKIFILGTAMEAAFEDNSRLVANKKETQAAFEARVTEAVMNDFMDDKVELIIMDYDFVSTFTVDAIKKAYLKALGVQKELFAKVLEDKGEELPTEEPAAETKESGDSPKTLKFDGKGKLAKVTKNEGAEKVAAEKAPKVKKEKVVKEKVEKVVLSDEEKQANLDKALAAAEIVKTEWQPNKGNTYSFVPYKDAKPVEAVMIGVIVDKRVAMVLVRLKDEDGKLYHKVPLALTFVKKAEPVAPKEIKEKAPKAEKAPKVEKVAAPKAAKK